MSIDNSMAKAEKTTQIRTKMRKIGLFLERTQRPALLLIGLFCIGLGFYLGTSFRSMGTTLYMLGVWSASTGLFLGIRNRYNVVSMGVGIILMLGYRYPLLIESGLGIVLGAFNALLHSINKAGKAKKIRLSPPKPPFMAIYSVR
jgi:hypothetical protein